MSSLISMGQKAKEASYELGVASPGQKNEALTFMAEELIKAKEEIIKAREIADNALVSLKINKNQCPTDFYLMLVAGAHFLREERAVVTRDFRRNETIETVLRGLGLKKTVATSAARLLKLKK